jgi:hypothetical protein
VRWLAAIERDRAPAIELISDVSEAVTKILEPLLSGSRESALVADTLAWVLLRILIDADRTCDADGKRRTAARASDTSRSADAQAENARHHHGVDRDRSLGRDIGLIHVCPHHIPFAITVDSN